MSFLDLKRRLPFVYAWLDHVVLPRRIVIRNIRLGVSLRVLQLSVIFGVAMLLLGSKAWVKVTIPSRMGPVTVWDNAAASTYALQDAADLASRFCTSPRPYDYVFSSDKWRYENYSCITPAVVTERFIKEGNTGIFAPLAYEETHYNLVSAQGQATCAGVTEMCRGTGGWIREGELCKCSTSYTRFITGAAALEVAFNHGYEVGSPGRAEMFDGGGSSQWSHVSCKKQGVCEAPDPARHQNGELVTLLVVKDADGEEKLLGLSHSPETTTVPVARAMELAGVSLDSRVNTVENLLYCGTSGAEQPCREDVNELPVARQVGVNIFITLHYANMLSLPPLPPCDGCLRDHVGPVCKATISVEPGWSSMQTQDCRSPRNPETGEASCTLKYSQGVRVLFHSTGSFGILDPQHILMSVAYFLVYLGIPLVIVDYVATMFLGALSDVYLKAECEVVKIDSQLAGFVVRMITAQKAFTAVTGDIGTPMEKSTLRQLIGECLSTHGELEPQELVNLTDITMNALDEGGDGQICMKDFVNAASSNDVIDLKAALKLFDSDRRVSIMESIFMPKSLKKNRMAVHHMSPRGRAQGALGGAAQPPDKDVATLRETAWPDKTS